MKVTPKELIEETANYYNLSNRGYDEEEYSCRYLALNGNMCAVGRCILEDKIEDFNERFGVKPISSIIEDYGNVFVSYVDPKYSDISKELWAELQVFHDRSSNWTNTGASNWGMKSKEELLEKFAW